MPNIKPFLKSARAGTKRAKENAYQTTGRAKPSGLDLSYHAFQGREKHFWRYFAEFAA
jgi:hypothetical protein